jgi:hypothetical protein
MPDITSWSSLASMAANLAGTYSLSVDLDSTSSGYAGIGDAWVPIGNSGTPFTGVFNGGGHTISDMIVTGTTYRGLFGKVSGATISGVLGILNASISGTDFCGILAGWSNESVISKVYASGSVSGDTYIGGLVGETYAGTISDCYSYHATITAAVYYAGGICGEAFLATVVNCYSIGTVFGKRGVGGLAGIGGPGSLYLTNCYAVSDINVMLFATAWAGGQVYAQANQVYSGTMNYICQQAHTSGTFADDLAAGKWKEAGFGGLVGLLSSII